MPPYVWLHNDLGPWQVTCYRSVRLHHLLTLLVFQIKWIYSSLETSLPSCYPLLAMRRLRPTLRHNQQLLRCIRWNMMKGRGQQNLYLNNQTLPLQEYFVEAFHFALTLIRFFDIHHKTCNVFKHLWKVSANRNRIEALLRRFSPHWCDLHGGNCDIAIIFSLPLHYQHTFAVGYPLQSWISMAHPIHNDLLHGGTSCIVAKYNLREWILLLCSLPYRKTMVFLWLQATFHREILQELLVHSLSPHCLFTLIGGQP